MSAKTYTAFRSTRRVASGTLRDVAIEIKRIDGVPKAVVDAAELEGTLLIFDDQNGRVVDVDFRGTVDAVLRRLEKHPLVIAETAAEAAAETRTVGEGPPRTASARPGRPKLGVVSREVTLLPRHWDWLGSQPGGASVTLRKLVEDARRRSASRDRVRNSQEAAYRFMTAMAGNLPHFEEGIRALYADDRATFTRWIGNWPVDIREYAAQLAEGSFVRESGKDGAREIRE